MIFLGQGEDAIYGYCDGQMSNNCSYLLFVNYAYFCLELAILMKTTRW